MMIEHNGKAYITSKEWHEQVKPTAELRLTNRSIRGMETYAELVSQGHIVELTKDEADPFLGSLVVANSYNPVMLLDAVAQKEIEHYFEETAKNAVQSSKESAALGLAGIRLDLLTKDPTKLMMVQMLSQLAEVEDRQNKLEALVPKLIDEAALRIGGHAGYMTILAYARMRRLRISATYAASLGKAAAKACTELGYEIQKVPDARFGQINAYPEEVLEAVFNEEEGK